MITSYSNPASKPPEPSSKRREKLLLAFVILVTTCLGGAAVFFFWRLRGSQTTKPDLGLLPKSPPEMHSNEPVSADWIDVSELKTVVNKADENPVGIAVCTIGFWNIVPPRTPVEQLMGEARGVLEEIKSAVLSGADFEVACKESAGRLVLGNSDYSYRFYRRESHNGRLFNNQNKKMEDGVKEMSVGDLEIFPAYDGGYTDDGIPENDGIYVSSYYLIERVK